MGFIILLATAIFMNTVFYFAIKRESTYHDKRLFYVSVPDWAIDSIEIQAIIKQFNQEVKIVAVISLLLYLPILLIPAFQIEYLLIVIWLNLIIVYHPLRKAHKNLLALKKLRSWPDTKVATIKVDLSLSAYMEKHPFALKRYIIVLLVDCIALMIMLYFKADKQMYLYAILQFVVLIAGIVFIKRLPNKTFCSNTKANITLNLLRRDSFHHCFFFLILGDASFNLALQLFLLEKLSFIILVSIIILLMICVALVLIKANRYHRKKTEILNHYHESEYVVSDDSCWKIGLLGPTYYNAADPRTFISNGSQMTFNTAKASYKIFVISIIAFIVALLLWLIGYPYYLDKTNQLVDLSINDQIVMVDSPFSDARIDLTTVNKAELTDDLGPGVRTNGTDAMVYGKGKYTFDNYGKCLVYKASLHPCFIILYTNDVTYIINDDDIDHTKLIYQQIQEVLEQ